MPQDQDDIKGADAMKQAPTPGPLSGEPEQDLCFGCQKTHDVDDLKIGFCLECERIGKAWSQTLAPTAPVEASGSELADAIERVDRWANYEYTYADTVAVGSPLSTFTAGDLRLILAAVRPQPSGETRDGPTKAEILGVVRQYCAPAWCSVDRLTDALHALSARPAPVASGGQHSSATDFPPVVSDHTTRRWNIDQDGNDLLVCDGLHDKHEPCDFVRYTPARAEALNEGAAERSPRWVNGDYTPTEAMVEAGREHMIPAVSEEKLIRAFMEMMKQAEIDGLIAYAHPSPTPAADADRVRELEKSLENMSGNWADATVRADKAEALCEEYRVMLLQSGQEGL